MKATCGDWMKAPDSLALICGMAGSRLPIDAPKPKRESFATQPSGPKRER